LFKSNTTVDVVDISVFGLSPVSKICGILFVTLAQLLAAEITFKGLSMSLLTAPIPSVFNTCNELGSRQLKNIVKFGCCDRIPDGQTDGNIGIVCAIGITW